MVARLGEVQYLGLALSGNLKPNAPIQAAGPNVGEFPIIGMSYFPNGIVVI
jgi:hypothetical protein